MGAFISSHRTFSFGSYDTRRRKLERSRRHQLTDKERRCSANRPVLRLQIKPETLKRRTQELSALHSAGRRSSMRDQRGSGAYDHFPPRSSSVPPLSIHTTTNHDRPLSSDSMMVVHFIDNGRYDLTLEEKDDNDYDHLLPLGEFDHLCTCQYRRVNSGESTGSSEGDHMSTVQIGRDPRILQNFDIASLRERILQHTPPSIEVELVEGRHRRSQSVDALNSYKIRNNFENLPQRRRVQSTSYLDDDRGWSLGEIVMRSLSQTGINLFNIENPTHESELEVNRVWPHLKDKMRKWRQSQQSLNKLDEEEFSVNSNVTMVTTTHGNVTTVTSTH